MCSHRRLLLALVLVAGVAFAADRLAGAWAGLLIALAFLFVPERLAPEGRDPWRRYGLTRAGAGRGLAVAGLWMLIVFPLFSLAFSAFHQVVLDRPFVPEVARLLRWHDDLRGPPSQGVRALVVRVGDDERLRLTNRSAEEVVARLAGVQVAGSVRAGQGARVRGTGSPQVVQVTLAPGAGVRVDGRGPVGIEVRQPAGLPVLGPAGDPLPAEGGAVRVTPGWWPWLTFLLWQILAIALAEEWFFRGFLQTEWDAHWGRPWRVLGAQVGPAWLVADLVFAVGHLVSTPHPARLLVFFPGLLMGWLRARTGGLVAPIAFHAAANLLMEVLVRLYGA